MEIWTRSPRCGASETHQLHPVGVKCSGSPVGLRALASVQTQETACWLRALVGQKHSAMGTLDSHLCRSYQGQTINGRTLALLGLDKTGVVKERHIWNWGLFSLSFVWKISGEYDAIAHESQSVPELVTLCRAGWLLVA